jgi:hypothetical protein
LELGSTGHQVEERSDLVEEPTLEAPPDLHSCHDIEQWFANKLLTYCTNTFIFVDEHARWKHSFHKNFAPYEWIDSHYEWLDASSLSMSSMIYELVHFLSKFVVICLHGLFIHNDHIAHHQLHDNTIILSTNFHVHAIDNPSFYDIILHNGHINHSHNTFVCTTN